MDVTSLFTNIPHQDGIQACGVVWEERKIKDPPIQTLIRRVTLILKCNNFELNGKHYLKVQGTVMGTKMASAYASSIFTGRLEGQLLRSVTLRPFSWLRFIDNVDIKWSHGREIWRLSSTRPITSTQEISNEQHVFLHSKFRLLGDAISADLYTKPTDTHQYLVPTSCHSNHCCKHVPYGLALRLKRICFDSDTFESSARELPNHLCKRGYQKQAISLATERAWQQNRVDLLSYSLSLSLAFSPSCCCITQT